MWGWSDFGGKLMRARLTEYGVALILALLIIALIIATTDTSPQWIYQGF